MREIVLDVETTGLDPRKDRIIEIACVELKNFMPTGSVYQQYVNPGRVRVHKTALAIHGITDRFLRDYPMFDEIAGDLVDFVGRSRLIIHNAPFDTGFLRAEMKRAKLPIIQNTVIDTVDLAKKKFPGANYSLDALCRRFRIDLSMRSKHDALLDCELLAKVYMELSGGRQPALFSEDKKKSLGVELLKRHKVHREPRVFKVTSKELAAHKRFIKELNDPVWLL